MNYTKLIKLLYIADKESFRKWNTPITCDNYVSMKNGPVLSKTYNFIKNESLSARDQKKWNVYFQNDGRNITQVKETADDELSQSEIDILDEIDTKFKNHSYSDMIEYTHDKKHFPEVKWDVAKSSCIAVDIFELLKSIGKSSDEIIDMQRESDIRKEEFEVLGRLV